MKHMTKIRTSQMRIKQMKWKFRKIENFVKKLTSGGGDGEGFEAKTLYACPYPWKHLNTK